jgi:hypothetical protein
MANILIWPDINFEPGHWRPVIAMAQKLSQQHTIHFLTTPECEIILQGYGYNYTVIFEDYYPVGYSTLASDKPEEARSRIDHCQRIAEGHLQTVFDTFRPDLLIAGYFIAMEAQLISYRHQIQLPNNNTRQFPYLITTTFLRHPNEDPAITSLRFLVHHSQEIASKLMNAADSARHYDGSFDSIKEFIEPMDNKLELITCPKSLDYDNFVHRQKTRYVEPSILIEPGDGFDPGIPYKLIYASAGSRVRDYLESARKLFQILERLTNLPNMNLRYLNLAVGHDLQEDFYNKPRIHISGWANQTADLQKAKSAVIHGGLATLKECIYFGIPPVIVPLGKDQMDNALRVLKKKLGTMVMLDTLTPDLLANAIIDVEKCFEIRDNIDTLKLEFQALERQAPSVGLVNDCLNGRI